MLSIWSWLTQSMVMGGFNEGSWEKKCIVDHFLINTLISYWMHLSTPYLQCCVCWLHGRSTALTAGLLWCLWQKDCILWAFLGSIRTMMSMQGTNNTISNTCNYHVSKNIRWMFPYGVICSYFSWWFELTGRIQNHTN